MIEFPEVLYSEETIDFLLGETRYRVVCDNEYELFVETKHIDESEFYAACVGTPSYYIGCILYMNRQRDEMLESRDVQVMAHILQDRHFEVTFDQLEYDWKTLLTLADVRNIIDTRPVWDRLVKYRNSKKISKHSVNEQSEGAD